MPTAEGRPSLAASRTGYGSAPLRSQAGVPHTPRHLVSRPRLDALLDELLEYPLTAVTAPAGSGKTVLVADWVRRSPLPRAWVTLEQSDRDPAQLHTSLTRGLDHLVDGMVGVPVHADRPAGILVLDDLHHLEQDRDTQAALTAFVEHRPPGVHLVLLSRHHLPLPVDRLRGSGVLADVGFDVLRFSDDEAAAMLGRTCPGLPPDEVIETARRAAGWAVALQLAALSFRAGRAAPERHARSSTSSNDRVIDEYLWHEVLGAERAELIGLLRAVAPASRVNDGLAEALTADPVAGDLLREAESRGLFVSSVDDGGWFEVHPIMRRMMLTTLEQRSPQVLRELHARAAQWFEAVGDSERAVEHWLTSIPTAGVPADPETRIRDADGKGLRDALASLDPREPLAAVGWGQLAHRVALEERWDDAGPVETEARLSARVDVRRRAVAEAGRALGLALAGRPFESLGVVVRCRRLVEQGHLASVRDELAVADAIVARELGESRRAAPELERLAASTTAPAYVRMLAQTELVHLYLCDGEGDLAAQMLRHSGKDLEAGGAATARGGWADRLALAGVQLSLARDDVPGAATWASGLVDPFWGPLSAARIRFASGEQGAAHDFVVRAAPRCARHRVISGLVRARVLAHEDHDTAVAVAGMALETAVEHGMLQTVAAEGKAAMDLVELSAWRVPDAWMDRLRRLAGPTWTIPGPMVWPIEELTQREREVLRLLPSRLTQGEIAGELFVSRNTLKFHLRLIYRKLGARSRSDAVAIARLRSLLPRS